MGKHRITKHSGQRLYTDFMRTTRENTVIIICLDHFIKFVWLESLRKAIAGTVASFFWEEHQSSVCCARVYTLRYRQAVRISSIRRIAHPVRSPTLKNGLLCSTSECSWKGKPIRVANAQESTEKVQRLCRLFPCPRFRLLAQIGFGLRA